MNDARSIEGARWMVGQSMLTTEMDATAAGGWKRLRELPDHELLSTLDAYRDDFIAVLDGMWFRDEPIHCYFELTYANYLTLPRSVLQSMPFWWQSSFVKLLRWLDARAPEDAVHGYKVHAVDTRGRYAHDPYADYERGRRFVQLREPQP